MQEHRLRVMDQSNQCMNESTPPMPGRKTAAQENAPMGQIDVRVAPANRHLIGRKLADLQAVGTKLESFGEGKFAKLSSHDDVMRRQRSSPELASSSPDMDRLSMAVCRPDVLSLRY
jgi:hypothetical protein